MQKNVSWVSRNKQWVALGMVRPRHAMDDKTTRAHIDSFENVIQHLCLLYRQAGLRQLIHWLAVNLICYY